MKQSWFLVILAQFARLAISQTGGATSGQALGVPTLNTVRAATLSPAYSCQSAQVSQGYRSTALFLSSYSTKRNSPELLFNGACGAENLFRRQHGRRPDVSDRGSGRGAATGDHRTKSL
jgi:hypothetical protein